MHRNQLKNKNYFFDIQFCKRKNVQHPWMEMLCYQELFRLCRDNFVSFYDIKPKLHVFIGAILTDKAESQILSYQLTIESVILSALTLKNIKFSKSWER
jgi:hypothetical protein